MLNNFKPGGMTSVTPVFEDGASLEPSAEKIDPLEVRCQLFCAHQVVRVRTQQPFFLRSCWVFGCCCESAADN